MTKNTIDKQTPIVPKQNNSKKTGLILALSIYNGVSGSACRIRINPANHIVGHVGNSTHTKLIGKYTAPLSSDNFEFLTSPLNQP